MKKGTKKQPANTSQVIILLTAIINLLTAIIQLLKE